MYNRERARILVTVSSLFHVLRSRILLPLKGVAQVSIAICSNKIKRFLPGKSHNVHHICFNSLPSRLDLVEGPWANAAKI